MLVNGQLYWWFCSYSGLFFKIHTYTYICTIQNSCAFLECDSKICKISASKPLLLFPLNLPPVPSDKALCHKNISNMESTNRWYWLLLRTSLYWWFKNYWGNESIKQVLEKLDDWWTEAYWVLTWQIEHPTCQISKVRNSQVSPPLSST